jgi:hypothetical protein
MGKFSHCHFHNFLVHLDLPRSLQYKWTTSFKWGLKFH